jgi:hypothetical protein
VNDPQQQSMLGGGAGSVGPKSRMPQFIAVSRKSHGGKKWRRPPSYGFAAANAVAPIVATEVAPAALAMPLAFVQEAGRFVLVAVLSFPPGRNMFVAPDGRWLGGYVPACFRAYPFALVPQPGSDQVTLCMVADSLVVADGSAGEDFFDQDGNISPALKKTVDFLTEMERSRKATEAAVSALAEAGVIQSWQLKVKAEQDDKPIAGLHHIDVAALNQLSDDAFLKLRRVSAALPIAFAQMLSAGQLSIFGHLARLQAKLTPPPTAGLPENLDNLFELPADDTVQFR